MPSRLWLLQLAPSSRRVDHLSMSEPYDGGCLCGAVRFRTGGALRGVVYCHCSQCRKQSGHFYAATNVADADIVIEGTESITWYEASAFARRGFCKTCGSVLFWKPRATTLIPRCEITSTCNFESSNISSL